MTNQSKTIDIDELKFSTGVRDRLINILVISIICVLTYYFCSFVWDEKNPLLCAGIMFVLQMMKLGTICFKVVANIFYPQNIAKSELGSAFVTIGFLPVFLYFFSQVVSSYGEHQLAYYHFLFIFSYLGFLSGSLNNQRIDNINDIYSEYRQHIIMPKAKYWILFINYYVLNLLICSFISIKYFL